MLRNRAWQQAFERLERLEGKLSRAVLRGREVSNGLLLPDLVLKTTLEPVPIAHYCANMRSTL
jgi:hypothetical protein